MSTGGNEEYAESRRTELFARERQLVFEMLDVQPPLSPLAEQAGESWAREKATSEALIRLRSFGELLRDMFSAEWPVHLQDLFKSCGDDLDVLASVVHLIDPTRDTDEASLTGYWAQVAGEELSQGVRADLAISFAQAAITVALSGQTPQSGRELRGFPSLRHRHRDDSPGNADSTNTGDE